MWGWDRELAPPGVQDPAEAGEVPADVPCIAGEFLDRPCRGVEERGIRGPLVAAQKGAQGLGHREGDQEMVPGQGAGEPLFQPRAAPLVLALRAVPVPAGAEGPVHFSTLAALVARHPTGVAAAGHEGVEGFAVRLGNAVLVVARYSGPKVRKSSLSWPMVQPSHDGVDELGGVLLPLLGEVEVDHGGLQVRVAQVPLDGPEVPPRFQQVGGIGVAPMPAPA